MEPGYPDGVCEHCGRPYAVPVSSVGTVRCDLCADDRRRAVVARLRERYGEARELVAREPSDAQHHAHLEWILGTRRNPERDEMAFDTGVSELIVLWLQDLAMDLDRPALLPFPPDGEGGGGGSAADLREGVAQRLRVATGDFAEAFLSQYPRLAREP